jgi:hypothetical protein
MELSALSENIVPVPYKRGNDELILQVNIDAFTPEFWRKLRAEAEKKYKDIERQVAEAVKESTEVKGAKKPRKLTKAQEAKRLEEKFSEEMKSQLDDLELTARRLEAEREANIEFLIPHVLKGWDATNNGVPVPLTKEVLMPLPPKLIQEIFDLCVKAAKTVKKTDDEEETQASTHDGSPGLRVVGQSA